MSPHGFAIRTAVISHRAEPALHRALRDVRSAVNALLSDWRSRPDETRFEATKRSYPVLRRRYPHLASGWCVTATNETIAVLNAWDRSIRRARREDPERFERMRRAGPRRRRLKATVHPDLFAFRGGRLRITLQPGRHLEIDLNSVSNPLFVRYGRASDWTFGLTVTADRLLFHFRVPHEVRDVPGTVGLDLNFRTAVVAADDGLVRAVDLDPVLKIQDRMRRKRAAIDRAISKDRRHRTAVHRRYRGRERRRTDAQLHAISNQLVKVAGERAVVVEDLTDLTQGVLRRGHRSPQGRARLSAWVHGRLVTLIAYKLHTPMVRVNPEGTSQECPRCGGHTALSREEEGSEDGGLPRRMPRRTVCEDCGSAWHRDVAAAIAVLARGRPILRGATVPPSARSALLEAAAWRSRDESLGSLMAEPVKGDDAKPGTPRHAERSSVRL